MSRSSSTQSDAGLVPVPRQITRAEIDAALDRARRLRAEVFAAWLGRVATGTHNLVIRCAGLLRRRRIAG